MNQLKSQPKLTSKDKESTLSSQDVASIWVSIEVDYTHTINNKTTKQILKLMGNAQKRCYWGEVQEDRIKNENEGMKREKSHLKIYLNKITKNQENNSTIRIKFDKHGNNVSMYETVKEVDKEKIIKENFTQLTRDNTTSLQSDNVEDIG